VPLAADSISTVRPADAPTVKKDGPTIELTRVRRVLSQPLSAAIPNPTTPAASSKMTAAAPVNLAIASPTSQAPRNIAPPGASPTGRTLFAAEAADIVARSDRRSRYGTEALGDEFAASIHGSVAARDAVRQSGFGECGNVVGDDIVSTPESGPGSPKRDQ